MDGKRIGKPWRHHSGVHRLRMNESGGQLVTASFDTRSQVLNSETEEPIGLPYQHQGALKGVAFSLFANIFQEPWRDGAADSAITTDTTKPWRSATRRTVGINKLNTP